MSKFSTRRGSNVVHDMIVEILRAAKPNQSVSLDVGSSVLADAFNAVVLYNRKWIGRTPSNVAFGYIKSFLTRKEIAFFTKNSDGTCVLSPKGEKLVEKFATNPKAAEDQAYKELFSLDKDRKPKIAPPVMTTPFIMSQQPKEESIFPENAISMTMKLNINGNESSHSILLTGKKRQLLSELLI